LAANNAPTTELDLTIPPIGSSPGGLIGHLGATVHVDNGQNRPIFKLCSNTRESLFQVQRTNVCASPIKDDNGC
jgi:hypothetical protein